METCLHTDAPWVIERQDYDETYGDCGRLVIRNCETDHPQGAFVIAEINQSRGAESRANARLIAAAPELLEALQNIVANVQEPCAVNQDRQQWVMRKLNETLYDARAAIAKATGATP